MSGTDAGSSDRGCADERGLPTGSGFVSSDLVRSAEPLTPSSLVSRLVVARTDSWLLQLFRYGFVAVLAFAADFGTFLLLQRGLAVHYLWANVGGFVVGLTVNYLTSVAWVFGTRRYRSRTAEFAVFAMVGVAGLGVNQLVIWTAVELLRFTPVVGKLISTAIVFFWNFGLRKALAFSRASAQ